MTGRAPLVVVLAFSVHMHVQQEKDNNVTEVQQIYCYTLRRNMLRDISVLQ